MNITVKRLLIMFSVALNIGFVIAAAVLIATHPPLPAFPDHDKMRQEIISRLKLPPADGKSLAVSMEKMETTHKEFMGKLHRIRNEVITLLSRPGAVDQKRFESLNKEILELMARHNHAARAHLLGIRNQLGDENGARFFSELLRQMEKRSPEGHH